MNKIMEYMAMARPIVSFDLREMRVSAGDAALFATPNDEQAFARLVARLLDDPEERRRMGARSDMHEWPVHCPGSTPAPRCSPRTRRYAHDQKGSDP